MSWSFYGIGTKEAVKKIANEQLTASAKNYKGKPEGADVLYVRDRILAKLDELQTSGYANGVSVKASGHEHAGALSFSLEITTTPILL